MTSDQLIAEISSDLRQYDETVGIDDISMKRWIRNELLRFGGNLMDLCEKTVQIKNNKVKLPDDFWQLYLAVRCEPNGYEVTEGSEDFLQNSLFYRERLERDAAWDNESNSFRFNNHKQIVEKFVFRKNKVNFYYNNAQFLRLSKGIQKDVCHPKSKHLSRELTRDLPYEINIRQNTLYTNFKEGYIYLQYYGLPTDEDGDLYIPDTQHRRVEEYLMYYCKKRIMEHVVANGDASGNDLTMLQYFSTEADKAFGLAMTEAKFEGLGKDWASRVRNATRRETLKYEAMLPWI